MLSSPTILLPSEWTPEHAASGIVLGPISPTAAGGVFGAWAHGIAIFDENDLDGASSESVAHSIVVAAIAEPGQQSGAVGIVASRERFFDSSTECLGTEGAAFRRLAFSIDLVSTFGPLLQVPCHVHVSFRRHRSEVQRFAWPEAAPATDVMPRSPMEALLRGYVFARADDAFRAIADFTIALGDPLIEGDWDGAHLYNGACLAARVAATSPPGLREALETRALEWLRKDQERLNELLEPLERDLRLGKGTQSTASRHESLSRRREAARSEDVDFTALRTSARWKEFASRCWPK